MLLTLALPLVAGSCGKSLPGSNSSRSTTTASTRPSWRDPGISATIQAHGETALNQRVLTVQAKSTWVDTGLSIGPGKRLWVDTATNGQWSGNPQYFPFSDANGLPVYPAQYKVDADAAVLSLIGFVGDSPPTPSEVSVSRSAPAGGRGGIVNPGFVSVGDTLLAFSPTTSGKLWLRNNDNTNYVSDVGQQVAKVIISD